MTTSARLPLRESSRSLSILVVSPHLPYPPEWGFTKRAFHLIEALASRHRVTVLSYVFPDQDLASAQLADQVHELVAISRPLAADKRMHQLLSLASSTPFHARHLSGEDFQRALDDLLARKAFDVILVESSQLGWLTLPRTIPVVVDEHNIESELLGRMARTEDSVGRRLYNSWESRRYRAFEKRVWESSSACSATSQRDVDTIARECPSQRVMVVPNGVAADTFVPSGIPATPGSIVFAGVLRYRPNMDGIRWFLDEVFPLVRRARPDVHLTVVGGGSPDALQSLRGPGVTVTGWVPDILPFLDSAEVAVVPLRMGGGTRLKVLEAMSARKAIVSTSLGAEGVEVTSGEQLLLADDRCAFADAIVRLLDDPGLRDRMGGAARDRVLSRYLWQHSAAALESLFLDLVDAEKAGTRPSIAAADRSGR